MKNVETVNFLFPHYNNSVPLSPVEVSNHALYNEHLLKEPLVPKM